MFCGFGRYQLRGLDLQELRAVHAALPQTFENDNRGQKAEWAAGLNKVSRRLLPSALLATSRVDSSRSK